MPRPTTLLGNKSSRPSYERTEKTTLLIEFTQVKFQEVTLAFDEHKDINWLDSTLLQKFLHRNSKYPVVMTMNSIHEVVNASEIANENDIDRQFNYLLNKNSMKNKFVKGAKRKKSLEIVENSSSGSKALGKIDMYIIKDM